MTEPAWNLNDVMRDEARDARRNERDHYRRVGDRYVDTSDLPDKDER